MKDELHKFILEGLTGELDGKLFEECAVDLLQSTYPALTPMKGGHDDGRDGLLFISVGGHEVPLVCTTGGAIRSNLRSSLQQYVAKGHKGRSAIFATSQEVTPQERNKLDEIAAEVGFALMQVHARDDFALRLYRDKVWLKKLLNLESNQQALSINPVTQRPVISLSARGREGLQEWIGARKGDCLIVGQPGCGKTFALRAFIMDNDGLFVVSDNRDQITAEVREKSPKYLVIDDAHTKQPLLQAIKQIRQDTTAEFKIIATSWNQYRDIIKNDLTIADADILELELLGQDTILQIVKDCGVRGPDVLQAQIVRQAEGKPGLAATLCQLALSGEARDVYLGDSLGKHLVALFQRELGKESLDLLAVVALGGNAGITLKDTAEILKISEMQAQTIASGLAFGGVISTVGNNALSVRPESLRFYLAKQRFFNGSAVVDPLSYLTHYRQLSDVVEVIIHTGLRGGNVSKKTLLTLVEEVGTPKLFAGYAAFGKNEAKEIINTHPDMALAEPSEYLTMVPEAIIPLMLEKAESDNLLRRNSSHHLLRILQNWVKNVLPEEDDVIARKKVVLKCLTEWRKASKDPGIFAQALASALVPSFETYRTDPGSGRSLSYARGHLSPTELEATIAEWKKIKPLLTGLTDECWQPLLGLLSQWTYERAGVNMPNADQERMLNAGAIQILEDLAEASTDYPAIQASLQPKAAHLSHPIAITRDSEYDTLFPVRGENRAASWAENEPKQLEAVKKLAVSYAQHEPATVVRRVVSLTKQADVASHNWPRYTNMLAEEIAMQVANLAEWAEATVAVSEYPYFSFPFLRELHNKNSRVAKSTLLNTLKHNQHKFSAGEVILRRPFSDDDLWKAIDPILNDLALVVRSLIMQDQIDTETTLRLLRCNHGQVSFIAAETIAFRYSNNIPEYLLRDWENVVINARSTDSYSSDERIIETLEQHPATITKLLKARLAEEPGPDATFGSYCYIPSGLVKALSRDQRLALIYELPDTQHAEHIAHHLVGEDLDLFRALIANSNSRKYQLKPLSYVKGVVWIQFAEIAFNAGWDEDDVLAASYRLHDGWSGLESDHHKALIETVSIGAQSTNSRVAAVALKLAEYYTKLYEAARIREKRADIYGYSGY